MKLTARSEIDFVGERICLESLNKLENWYRWSLLNSRKRRLSHPGPLGLVRRIHSKRWFISGGVTKNPDLGPTNWYRYQPRIDDQSILHEVKAWPWPRFSISSFKFVLFKNLHKQRYMNSTVIIQYMQQHDIFQQQNTCTLFDNNNIKKLNKI